MDYRLYEQLKYAPKAADIAAKGDTVVPVAKKAKKVHVTERFSNRPFANLVMPS